MLFSFSETGVWEEEEAILILVLRHSLEENEVFDFPKARELELKKLELVVETGRRKSTKPVNGH